MSVFKLLELRFTLTFDNDHIPFIIFDVKEQRKRKYMKRKAARWRRLT